MKKALPFAAGLLATTTMVAAQADVQPTVLRAWVVEGDTVPIVQLPETEVVDRWSPRDRREAARYDRLTRNVLKVYPYARVTGELLREYEHDLSLIDRNGDQQLYLKVAEAELRAEFEAELRDLTMSQGRILIKLIDRETGKTSYALVKELKGSFQAFLWQGLAKFFGHDLKTGYDRHGDDRLVEVIVQRIERGELTAPARSARTDQAQARLDKRKARLYRKYGLPLPEACLL